MTFKSLIGVIYIFLGGIYGLRHLFWQAPQYELYKQHHPEVIREMVSHYGISPPSSLAVIVISLALIGVGVSLTFKN